jgi:hypothetical protein
MFSRAYFLLAAEPTDFVHKPPRADYPAPYGFEAEQGVYAEGLEPA